MTRSEVHHPATLLRASIGQQLSLVFIVSLFLNSYGTVHAATIGTWNEARGGSIAFTASNSITTQYFTSVSSAFPEIAFLETDTLTANFAAQSDVLLLHPATSATTSSTPLSSEEQDVLFDFVKGGGHALLYTDVFLGTVADSILEPFGLSFGFSTSAPFGVSIPDHPIVDGPFGSVSSATSNIVTAGFDDLGLYATSIASYGNDSAIAVIEEGAISPNSGRVVVFSESFGFVDEQFDRFDNETLALNSVAYVVPEPSSSALLLLGSLLLLGVRQKGKVAGQAPPCLTEHEEKQRSPRGSICQTSRVPRFERDCQRRTHVRHGVPDYDWQFTTQDARTKLKTLPVHSGLKNN